MLGSVLTPIARWWLQEGSSLVAVGFGVVRVVVVLRVVMVVVAVIEDARTCSTVGALAGCLAAASSFVSLYPYSLPSVHLFPCFLLFPCVSVSVSVFSVLCFAMLPTDAVMRCVLLTLSFCPVCVWLCTVAVHLDVQREMSLWVGMFAMITISVRGSHSGSGIVPLSRSCVLDAVFSKIAVLHTACCSSEQRDKRTTSHWCL